MSSLILSESSVCPSIPWWKSCPDQVVSLVVRSVFEGYGWARMSPEKTMPSWSCLFCPSIVIRIGVHYRAHDNNAHLLSVSFCHWYCVLYVMRLDSCHSPLIGRIYACSRRQIESGIRASLLRLNACFLPPPMAGWDACFSRGGLPWFYYRLTWIFRSSFLHTPWPGLNLTLMPY